MLKRALNRLRHSSLFGRPMRAAIHSMLKRALNRLSGVAVAGTSVGGNPLDAQAGIESSTQASTCQSPCRSGNPLDAQAGIESQSIAASLMEITDCGNPLDAQAGIESERDTFLDIPNFLSGNPLDAQAGIESGNGFTATDPVLGGNPLDAQAGIESVVERIAIGVELAGAAIHSMLKRALNLGEAELRAAVGD